MLAFNQEAYQQTLRKWGIEKPLYAYKELLTSEIAYVNQFLYYLDDINIKNLLAVYNSRYFRLKKGEISQDQLQTIFDALKDLRDKQKDLIGILYRSDPEQWLHALYQLSDYYHRYIELSVEMVVPAKVELKFKEIQAEKMKANYQQMGSLGAVLIAPVQRLPRYGLLGKELLKAIEQSSANALYLKQRLTDFVNCVKAINAEINEKMASSSDQEVLEEDEEPSSPYFEPSGRLHPVSTDYQLNRHLAPVKRLRKHP